MYINIQFVGRNDVLLREIRMYYNYRNSNENRATCVHRKARRKERDGDQSATTPPLYLEENVLERKLPDADLKMVVDLPAGLDFNEWLASHSKFFFGCSDVLCGLDFEKKNVNSVFFNLRFSTGTV